MPALYVMTDADGPWPVLWREPEPPREEPGRTWDYLGEVESRPGWKRCTGALTRATLPNSVYLLGGRWGKRVSEP